ncbi:MAG: hypothetical protein Q7S58_20545 [Candidatus Binatus sp.]|uniref:hypothetical protein n=1 Tax=Candidatus Binatus sp. TaxID=2811406 RepID=UPI00271C67D5|nr:hypothetical protein [Candidatus Binatus sp.]MDO8434794.1 hypothetical protein [Candidatus Binatus sp.]
MAHPKENEIDRDDAALTTAGFDPSSAPADAVARLRELRGTPNITDAAIARALGRITNAGAAAMLTEMEPGAAGALRREIRRALFRLKQHGIEPPATIDAPIVSGTQATASSITALLSPIDPEGARIVWLMKPRMQGGILRMWALISEADGLVGAQNTGLTRRELRNEREQLEARARMKLVEADWRLADFIICEAYRNTPEKRRGQVGNFMTLRAEMIGTPPAQEFEHPVYAEFAEEISREPSIELMKEPEIQEWRLPASLIKPYVDEINQLGESVIVLSAIQKQERVNIVLERAMGELLAGENAHRLRRRLEDIAYYMARDGRRVAAGWAAAAAAKIRAGADLKQVAFFQALLRAQLGALAAEEQQKVADEPRLIMTPAEAMRAREASRLHRR